MNFQSWQVKKVNKVKIHEFSEQWRNRRNTMGMGNPQDDAKKDLAADMLWRWEQKRKEGKISEIASACIMKLNLIIVHQKIRHGTSSAWNHAAQKLYQLRRHVRRIHPQTALVGRRPAQRVEAAVPDESLVNDTKIGQMI